MLHLLLELRNSFDNEKTELEKVLSEFNHRHTTELGDVILEILRLTKIKFKTNETKYREAETDEREYKEQIKADKEKDVFELNESDRQDLKRKFRKATTLCHPDKVSDEFKVAAQQIFIELKTAYDKNDLKRVTEILNDLETGSHFRAKSEVVLKKDLLKATIAKLRIKVSKLESEISAIKQSETYLTIKDILNWDEYFTLTKEKLVRELKSLQLELAIKKT